MERQQIMHKQKLVQNGRFQCLIITSLSQKNWHETSGNLWRLRLLLKQVIINGLYVHKTMHQTYNVNYIMLSTYQVKLHILTILCITVKLK